MKHEIKFNGVSEPWCLRDRGGRGNCSVQCPSRHRDSATGPRIAGFFLASLVMGCTMPAAVGSHGWDPGMFQITSTKCFWRNTEVVVVSLEQFFTDCGVQGHFIFLKFIAIGFSWAPVRDSALRERSCGS